MLRVVGVLFFHVECVVHFFLHISFTCGSCSNTSIMEDNTMSLLINTDHSEHFSKLDDVINEMFCSLVEVIKYLAINMTGDRSYE